MQSINLRNMEEKFLVQVQQEKSPINIIGFVGMMKMWYT